MSIVEGLLQFLNKVNDIISKKKTRRVRTLDIALKNAKVGQKVREFAVGIPISTSSCCQCCRSANPESQGVKEKLPEYNLF